jgi:hypothetical protein
VDLIAYSLACLLTCTNWVLRCICERLAKHVCRIFVALLEMMPSEFIYACLAYDRSLYACGDLLNLFIQFISYLSSWLFACYLVMVSLRGFTLVFASLGIMVVYNCLNTCLYILWSILILISAQHLILLLVCVQWVHCQIEYLHKIDRTLANRVVERRNMIKVYPKGKACKESVRGSFWFWALFAFSLVCRFSCLLLALSLFPHLDDPIKLFFDIRSSSSASWSLGFKT